MVTQHTSKSPHLNTTTPSSAHPAHLCPPTHLVRLVLHLVESCRELVLCGEEPLYLCLLLLSEVTQVGGHEAGQLAGIRTTLLHRGRGGGGAGGGAGGGLATAGGYVRVLLSW